MKDKRIAIYDSGFGGLTVLKAVQELMPYEQIVYFGDTAHLPYGNKSREEILEFGLQSLRFLSSLDIKLLIIACHTICISAFEELVAASPVPVVGMIKPTLSLVSEQSKKDKILLLGTKRTIASQVYQQMIAKEHPKATLQELACPLFVPLIEEGYANHPMAQIIVKEYLRPFREESIDLTLLVCTHYPLLYPLIQQELGPLTKLIDPALACARQARLILQQKNLLKDPSPTPCPLFYVSETPEKFLAIGKQFLPYQIPKVLTMKTVVPSEKQ